MMALLLGAGLVLTVATGGVQIRRFPFAVRQVLGSLRSRGEGEGTISPFQALATSLSATVGVGNIAGVSMAIASGGPGAVFWMFASAVLGMATKYSEIAVALEYRQKDEQGIVRGGAMYVLAQRFGLRWLGAVFAGLCAVASFGIGNMNQASTLADAMRSAFGVPAHWSGLALAALTALVVLGGLRRIAEVAAVLVPAMCLLYFSCALYVLATRLGDFPAVLDLIVGSAFSGQAAVGGFLGATVRSAMRYGIARGLNSNEAGMGSAPIAHAAAVTDHPSRQGTYGLFGVFVDTLVVCMLTAFTILSTGVWTSGKTGAALSAEAFAIGLPGDWGALMVSLSLVPFAFSTIVGWAYYGETAVAYLFGVRSVFGYRLAWVAFVFVGAVGGLEAVWGFSDTMNGLMAVPNLFAVLGSLGLVRRQLREFFSEPR